jgi:hypothetical protein
MGNMLLKNEYCSLDSKVTLRDRSESPLSVRTVSLALTQQNDTVIECRLTFQVSPELYQRIDTEALFNLKPEVRSPLSAGAFQPSHEIQIEASLDPDLLSRLTEHAADANQAAAYLQNISKEQPDNPLLSTHSWYGLQVKQQQETGETGYRTLWAYISPSVLTQDGISNERISEGMTNFIKEWTNASPSGMSQDAISETVEKMNKVFEEWTDSLSEMTEQAISETLEEVTSAFEEVAESLSEVSQETTSSKQIFQEIVNFFTEDDWPFTKLQGDPVLLTAFQGENGKWTCYAKARIEQEQFVFYSICPINAPQDKRMIVAEFLTRANSGTIVGNFELDFADGEIRYKTSIDVKGDLLSSTLIKQLVYANVMMMDEYLPGIKSVIKDDVSPADAIAQIEGQPG